MKRYILLFTILSAFAQLISAQQNISLVGQLGYNEDGNDIWGYVAPDSTEYALMGLRNGLSVVSLANPTNPVEVDYVPGASSTWRDIKVWGDYAYVTTDQGVDGLAVINLSYLPDSVTYDFWRPTITIDNVAGIFNQAHNIYIDENGVGYLAGGNLNSGGVLFIDVNTPTGMPNYLGAGPARYSHDVFVRGDTMWSSDISNGYFSVVDVSNKTSPVLLATQTTPFFFTHNAWLSDDGNTLFTTDEQGNAPVASYDVSDLSNIQLLDEFRPPATVGAGVIPHNTHTMGDFQVVSYYTDGLVIIDATMPDWMVQAGQYDTYSGPDGGFNGCWGAYPFLPSGLILASDINTGLYVLSPNYQRACYLNGNITDSNTSLPLDGASISFDTEPVSATADLGGDYKTGYGTSGTFDITYSFPGYSPQTISVSLVAGQIVTQDVALVKLPSVQVTGQVYIGNSSTPIPGAKVVFEGNGLSENATADATGSFTVPSLVIGSYDVIGGKWGYEERLYSAVTFDPANTTIEIRLFEGYVDGFALDQGWTVSGNATSGAWERGDPIGVNIYGIQVTPPSDDPTDIGTTCYVTGNNSDLVAGRVSGTTTLTSPVFDATIMVEPIVNYLPWFLSATQQGGATSSRLRVFLNDGTNQVMIEELDFTFGQTQNWRNTSSIKISDFITPTSTMNIIFETEDLTNSNITEAGVDFFVLTEAASSVVTAEDAGILINVSPNPASDQFNLVYDVIEHPDPLTIRIYNALGQSKEEFIITDHSGEFSFGKQFSSGVYFIQIRSKNQTFKAMKVIKTE